MIEEKKRLKEDLQKKKHWRRWGPYLSGRQWGTVREDYSRDGDVWRSFPFSQAQRRVYKWGEDGIGGISDNHQRLCFAPAFWNRKDPILKERLFGLSNLEGKHGEDVKEVYYYLDNVPSHTYMRMLYKYPQREFPYQQLVEGNQNYLETGIFAENQYFDIFIEYAKDAPEDLYIRLTLINRSSEEAALDVLPQLWFRKTELVAVIKGEKRVLVAHHPTLGTYFLYFEEEPRTLFTENETTLKGAFNDYVVHGKKNGLSKEGTKAALLYQLEFAPKEMKTVRLRLCQKEKESNPFSECEKVFKKRKEEVEAFYNEIFHPQARRDLKEIQKAAFAGLLWNKQFYHYVVEKWLKGVERTFPRNQEWKHLYNDDILSVPDKWEYPSFFSWDTAFQSLPLAMIDPAFAKKQLHLLTREWYMHPNGQIPAYEWAFSDVNPPVHAWATWRVFKIEKKMHSMEDRLFLERVFQKLLLNFTWWVNRKDSHGKNIFQGGFLGLDNISLFNRSEPFPGGGELYQSDATSWMGMYCLNMLAISLELAKENLAYEDMASKFFEHFLYISEAIMLLWDEEEGFYYDLLKRGTGEQFPLKVRSLVGLVPLFAVTVLTPEIVKSYPGFTKRLNWFCENRKDLCSHVSSIKKEGIKGRRLLSIVSEEQLRRILAKVLDEGEFLSRFGIRSLSRYHEMHSFVLKIDAHEFTIGYEPGEATTPLLGGNSNWRGPIWFPLNMLLIEALQKFHYFYGDDFKVECPTGSGNWMNLWEVAGEISKRLISLFVNDEEGKRPCMGSKSTLGDDHLLFHEYFHAETGEGLGASHQTGWTALIAKLIRQSCQYGLF